ncbi:hypothetical protein SteCoe_16970 [Stentor coeruleus]|uniref:MD-2-related lipid-recognition domain-containing protein n=1 Tax=Stentor coeruleus TaxID=5963 RepID=A0A1R2C048_9CILI|nr:hypothetical protein SteCoe_16970 [Stentor coeruleus]
MNKFLVALAVIALVNAGGVVEEQLASLSVGQQCSNPINAYAVTEFDVTPFPPTKGSTVVSKSVGTFNQAETITAIKVQVLLNGRNFYSETIPESGTFTAGQVGTFTYTQAVPSIAPKGAYTIQGGLINSNKQQISCWELNLDSWANSFFLWRRYDLKLIYKKKFRKAI